MERIDTITPENTSVRYSNDTQEIVFHMDQEESDFPQEYFCVYMFKGTFLIKKTTIKTYLYLLGWSASLSLLLSHIAFVLTIVFSPQKQNRNLFINRVFNYQFYFRWLGILCFAPCCVYIYLHMANSYQFKQEKYLKIIIWESLTFFILILLHYYLSLFSVVLHTKILNNLSYPINIILLTFLCLFEQVFIVGFLFMIKRKWSSKYDHKYNPNVQRLEKYMRILIYIISYFVLAGAFSTIGYTIPNYEKVKRLVHDNYSIKNMLFIPIFNL
ncbi:hypothetical protein NEFER03_1021 [Nematocida sp. LUAm3]|nr:hypothetical protein NEFER03_1021 [Nematocida sp. LUAm3]KAI5175375.1 hypothetical protein NEFER02_1304 [Nematocida sp. LUAm2]KAI5177668.1 hypothetical protein NEFER01_0892 [Nematocida sp. LUAm1]